MATNHLRMDGIKVFEVDDKRIKILNKFWGEKSISAIYRRALEESCRHMELHSEVDKLKQELSSVKEEMETTNMLLQDLYHLIGAKMENKVLGLEDEC